jgi:hypothetical protein
MCLDLTINLQSLVFNVFGCLDNLAWIWVTERQLKTAKGKPLTGNLVDFRWQNIYETFSQEFQNYLTGLNIWFEGMEDYRHALAHRIPLYIPPFVVHPTKLTLYNDLERQKNDALKLHDFLKYDEYDAEQEKLGSFNPAMMHSCVEGARRLIPLSQVHQYLGLDASCRVPVAVLRRRGPRRTVVTPFAHLVSSGKLVRNSFRDRALATESSLRGVVARESYLTTCSVTWDNGISLGARPVVFHFQVLADWNTVAEIAEMFLKLQNW